MFPAIGTGAASLVWISQGEVIDFALSALHLGAQGIIQRSEAAFSHGKQADRQP
jgi:hypothetical protein